VCGARLAGPLIPAVQRQAKRRTGISPHMPQIRVQAGHPPRLTLADQPGGGDGDGSVELQHRMLVQVCPGESPELFVRTMPPPPPTRWFAITVVFPGLPSSVVVLYEAPDEARAMLLFNGDQCTDRTCAASVAAAPHGVPGIERAGPRALALTMNDCARALSIQNQIEAKQLDPRALGTHTADTCAQAAAAAAIAAGASADADLLADALGLGGDDPGKAVDLLVRVAAAAWQLPDSTEDRVLALVALGKCIR